MGRLGVLHLIQFKHVVYHVKAEILFFPTSISFPSPHKMAASNQTMSVFNFNVHSWSLAKLYSWFYLSSCVSLET